MATVAMARMRADRIFYSSVPAVVALAVLVGFGPSWFVRPIFGQPVGFGPLTPLLVTHGTLMTLWLATVVAQPLLIASGNRDLHRSLGSAAVVLATLLVLLIPIVSIHSMRSGGVAAFPTIYLFASVNLIGDIMFATCVGLAIANRRRAETHKRLMLLALMPLVPPAIGRWPVLSGMMPASGFLLMDAILIAGCCYDRMTRGRIHVVWKWGVPLMLLGQALMPLVGFSGWWKQVGDWAMRLPV